MNSIVPTAPAPDDSLCRERPEYVFAEAPRNVYWETTIACDLACRHCRASAISSRAPDELTDAAAADLLKDVAELGSMLVLTGGDPLKRSDIFELIQHGRGLGVSISITPSITPSLSEQTVFRLRKLGVAAMGVSLDGPTAAVHDTLRGIDGTFELTMRALRWAAAAGLPVQINTTVTRATRPHLAELYRLLADRCAPPVKRWSLFFLIPVGRGTSLAALSAAEAEQVFDWVYDISSSAPFHISTVEAPSYRRRALQRKREQVSDEAALHKWAKRMGFGIRDGNGVVFVSYRGRVHPAGFLPLEVGDARRTSLPVIYRTAPMLRKLRDMDRLEGKCRSCRYRWLCGGSRARAYAATGNPMGPDPLCAYQPGNDR
jgi:radical SAM protein